MATKIVQINVGNNVEIFGAYTIQIFLQILIINQSLDGILEEKNHINDRLK